MKSIYILCFTVLFLRLEAQNVANKEYDEIQTAYNIQIESVTKPNPTSFSKLKGVGYVFAVENDNSWKVMMGTFSNKTKADAKLAEVKTCGYKGAFLQKVVTTEHEGVFVVQLGLYSQKETIRWGDWLKLSHDLLVQLSDDKLRICAGPYNTREQAEKALDHLASIGSKDIFIRKVSLQLLHKVTEFETAGSVFVSVDTRTINALQQMLTEKGYYKGPQNGQMTQDTKNALELYKSKNSFYKQALLLEQSNSTPSGKPSPDQSALDIVWDSPLDASVKLKAEPQTPVNLAFQAYLYFTRKVHAPDSIKLANELMQKAIKTAKSSYKGPTRLDYSKPVEHLTVEKWMDYLQEMYMMTNYQLAVPCWLFQHHPNEFAKAFTPYWKSNKDVFRLAQGCNNLLDFKELMVTKRLYKNALGHDSEDDFETEAHRFARYSILLCPQRIVGNDVEALNQWQQNLMVELSKSATNPQTQALKIAYYDSASKLENYFLQRKFSGPDAHVLAIKVLQTLLT